VNSKIICSCLYTSGKGPQYINRLGSGPVVGSGDMKSGDDVNLFACYINQNYQAPSRIFTFSAVWKTASRKPTALFATFIRDAIAPPTDSDEGNKLPFSLPDTWKDNFYFVLTNNLHSAGVLAVTSFGESDDNNVLNSDLPSFSFVTVDSLRRFGEDGINLRSGIVAYNGLMLSEEGRDEFDVTMNIDSFSISFSNDEHTERPTVVAMPNWFSFNEEFPPYSVDHLNFSIGKIKTDGFTINHTSAGSPPMPKSLLGFNFLVIGSNMPVTNIKHGIIYQCTAYDVNNNRSTKHGIHLSRNCSSAGSQNFKTETDGGGTHNGVKVSFISSFTDIPSVIATPYRHPMEENEIFRCLVDAITKSYAIVKCGAMSKVGKWYLPIPFTFVAVGNSN